MGGLFAYAQLSEIYEPSNYHRQIIGFDTFEGFPDWDPIDQVGVDAWGGLQPDHDSFTELTAAAAAFQKNAYIDTRNQTSQNILIEEDTIIEMEYFFYYVN